MELVRASYKNFYYQQKTPELPSDVINNNLARALRNIGNLSTS